MPVSRYRSEDLQEMVDDLAAQGCPICKSSILDSRWSIWVTDTTARLVVHIQCRGDCREKTDQFILL